MEAEMKLHVAPAEAPRLYADLAQRSMLGDYELGPLSLQRIRDVYFDTAGDDLGRRRMALRLRAKDGVALITLKMTRAASGGFFQREELETGLSPAALSEAVAMLQSLGALPPGEYPYSEFAAGRPTGALQPLLEAVSERQERPVKARGLSIALLVLDTVRYVTPAAGPYYDVEIELTRLGRPTDLTAIEALLQGVAKEPLQRARLSKLGRGLQLLGRAVAEGS